MLVKLSWSVDHAGQRKIVEFPVKPSQADSKEGGSWVGMTHLGELR